MTTGMIVVFITTPTATMARFIGKKLLHENLAKCVNVVPVTSFFVWKGKHEEQNEHLLIAKTTESKFLALERRVKQLHTYEVPEIIAIPVVKASKEYLEWMKS